MRVEIESKTFGDVPVLEEVAFTLGAMETLAVLGPSGIGKTTLLRLIAGLDRDFAGRIEGGGHVSMMFQDPRLLPWRTAAQNIALAARVDLAEARRLLAEVGLEGRGCAYPRQLSLGQQRRVALARAFAVRPETLLLDEPFVSLDAETAERMQALLAGLIAAHPARVVLVTHAPAEAARFANRVIRLEGHPARISWSERLALPPAERTPAWIGAASARLLGNGQRALSDATG